MLRRFRIFDHNSLHPYSDSRNFGALSIHLPTRDMLNVKPASVVRRRYCFEVYWVPRSL